MKRRRDAGAVEAGDTGSDPETGGDDDADGADGGDSGPSEDVATAGSDVRRPSRVGHAVLHAVGRQLARLGRHLGKAWPVLVVFLAQRLVTVLVLQQSGQLDRLAGRWDAGWYLGLARDGYLYPEFFPDGRPHASNLAYFPLYPWLVRRLGDASALSLEQSLVVVAWVGGLLGAWAVFAVGDALYGRWTGVALAALWGTAPASLALTMGYPEGMFTAAAAATLFFLIRRRPVWAGACAVVAGLLRPSAVAVVAMVAAYLLIELGRWVARLRSPPDATTAPAGTALRRLARAARRAAGTFPYRALLGAVVSTLGLGAFMVYVARRTGETLGYFTVQAQWGQSTAGPAAYAQGMQDGVFGTPTGLLVPATILVSVGYVLLFCLVLPDRRLVLASVYAAGLLVVTLSHITFQHVYARQLLPAFVLLIPLVRMRVPRVGAVAALTVASVLMSWGSADFLLAETAAM